MADHLRFIPVYLLLIAAAVLVSLPRDSAVPTARPLREMPLKMASWTMSRQDEFSSDILNKLKPTDYLSRRYRNPNGEEVQLYIGYHGGGADSGEIHSPKHCLPGSGWFQVSTRQYELTTPDGRLKLVQALYQKGDSREMFLYWFQVRNRSISSEYLLKIIQAMNSALANRRDAAFIRISVPVTSSPDKAVSLGEGFIQDAFPEIRKILPQ